MKSRGKEHHTHPKAKKWDGGKGYYYNLKYVSNSLVWHKMATKYKDFSSPTDDSLNILFK